MTPAEILLLVVTLQRLGELVLARRNTQKLLARGAIEMARRHYPLIVAVHSAWLLSLFVFGRDHPLNSIALICYIALQGLRGWVMWTLGSRWTTRIIVLPGEPLVTGGPYRFVSHPNYLVVSAEIILLPLVLALPVVAAVFTILNASVLAIRIRAENDALAASRAIVAADAHV